MKTSYLFIFSFFFFAFSCESTSNSTSEEASINQTKDTIVSKETTPENEASLSPDSELTVEGIDEIISSINANLNNCTEQKKKSSDPNCIIKQFVNTDGFIVKTIREWDDAATLILWEFYTDKNSTIVYVNYSSEALNDAGGKISRSSYNLNLNSEEPISLSFLDENGIKVSTEEQAKLQEEYNITYSDAF